MIERIDLGQSRWGLCHQKCGRTVKRTHPERVKGTHLGQKVGRPGQQRQAWPHSDFRPFLAFIDSRNR